VLGYCRYKVVTIVAQYFLEVDHLFFLHSLECSNGI
jgi:hypothetical protein